MDEEETPGGGETEIVEEGTCSLGFKQKNDEMPAGDPERLPHALEVDSHQTKLKEEKICSQVDTPASGRAQLAPSVHGMTLRSKSGLSLSRRPPRNLAGLGLK